MIKKHWFPRSDQHLYLMIISSWERALEKIAVLILPVIKFHILPEAVCIFLLSAHNHLTEFTEQDVPLRSMLREEVGSSRHMNMNHCTLPRRDAPCLLFAGKPPGWQLWQTEGWEMGSDWFTPGVWPTFMPDRSFILVWIQETVLVCALIKWVTLGVSLIVKMTTPCLRGN